MPPIGGRFPLLLDLPLVLVDLGVLVCRVVLVLVVVLAAFVEADLPVLVSGFCFCGPGLFAFAMGVSFTCENVHILPVL